MIEVKGANITCSLGLDTLQVYSHICSGLSGLSLHSGCDLGVTDDYWASTISQSDIRVDIDVPVTKLESMAIHSIGNAIKQTEIEPASDRTLFILSSTKGNIDLLDKQTNGIDRQRVYLPETARFISSHFGNKNRPYVVSNACISGLSAMILAKRLLDMQLYDDIIVVGADVISKFTVSGFQSFKALSNERCRPFDTGRQGLNLGEAAATIILSRCTDFTADRWYLEDGVMHNDANHISGPSRVGEGSYRCLKALVNNIDTDDIAMINTHGTATLYNDEMESIAIVRAGLLHIPVNAYKGYLGHTLGAAGILECILSMSSIDDGIILKTLGYEKCGVSRPLNIIDRNIVTTKRSFIKMMSGFGGSNAAVRMRKEVSK